MNNKQKERIEKIKEIVSGMAMGSDHTIDHIMRVHALCLKLVKAEKEKVDLEVLESATLLHDIGQGKEAVDDSGKTDHAIESAKMAKSILEGLGFSENKIKHIQDCIVSHRYKNEYEPKTIEAKLLFDSDKLDALGAIGIARMYIWLGRNDGHIFKEVENIEEYARENLSGKVGGRIQDKTKHSAQLEFETKTKFIVNKLHTKTGKEIGRKRLKFFKDFLDRLKKEVNGEM